jgi:outer membrane receptor protein involved in Fe transport
VRQAANNTLISGAAPVSRSAASASATPRSPTAPLRVPATWSLPSSASGSARDIRSNARAGTGGAQVATLCVAQGVPAAAISSYTFPTTATGQTLTGNTGLTPERADTYNVGAVFNAPRSSGILGDFSVSVDYYKINIKNVISTVPGLTVLSKCFNLDGSNPTYSNANLCCGLIQRDASGQLVSVATPYLNLGALTTFGYRSSAVGAGLRWRYQNAMKDVSSVLTPATAAIGGPAYSLLDLFGTVKTNKQFELRAGVNKLFDKGLPFVASSQNGTDTALYDPIGRSFYVGVKAGF